MFQKFPITQSIRPILQEVRTGTIRFLFAPASSRPLAYLRTLLAFSLIAQALSVSPHLFEMFGSYGIIQNSLARHLGEPLVPRLAGLFPYSAKWGLGEQATIIAISATYLVTLCFLLAGFKTRIASFLSWFLHWILMNSQSASYGADVFTHIGLFYLMFAPCGESLSLDAWLSGERDRVTSHARLSLRIFQIHLCIAYLASGLEKAVGIQWWNGEAIWRAMMLPVYAQYDMAWLAAYPWLCKAACWGTLLIELGYPVFIWPLKTRRLWVLLTVSLHLGIAVFLGLNLFAFVMSVFTLSLFAIPPQPSHKTWTTAHLKSNLIAAT